jgi:predicted RNase H-related nuclease YkuK (DUF458 family)
VQVPAAAVLLPWTYGCPPATCTPLPPPHARAEPSFCCLAAQNGGRVVFATVVCVISRGNAGRYFYARLVEPKRYYPVLQTRLLREVEVRSRGPHSRPPSFFSVLHHEPCVTSRSFSAYRRAQPSCFAQPRAQPSRRATRSCASASAVFCQLSLSTAELLTANDIDVQTVHCDSNTDPKCKSTEHTNMLTGYIQSMGYEYLVKPHAWATFVADRAPRAKVGGGQGRWRAEPVVGRAGGLRAAHGVG